MKKEKIVENLINHIYYGSDKRIALDVLKSNPDILYSDEFLAKAISQEYFNSMFKFFRVAERLKIIGKKEINFYFNNRSPKTGETIITSLMKYVLVHHKAIGRMIEINADQEVLEIEKTYFRETISYIKMIYKYSSVYNINPNVCNLRGQYPLDMVENAKKENFIKYDFFEEEYKIFDSLLEKYYHLPKEKMKVIDVPNIIDVRNLDRYTIYVRDKNINNSSVPKIDDDNLSKIKFKLLKSDTSFYLQEDIEDKYSDVDLYSPGNYIYISSVGSFFKRIVLSVDSLSDVVEHFYEKNGKLIQIQKSKMISLISQNFKGW